MSNLIQFVCEDCGFKKNLTIGREDDNAYEILEKNMIYIDHKQVLMEISLNGKVEEIDFEEGVYRCQRCHNLDGYFYYNMMREDKYIAKYISSYKNNVYRGIPQKYYNPTYYCTRCSNPLQHLNMKYDHTFMDDNGKKTTIHCPNCYSTNFSCTDEDLN
ncbi:hypothetical protein AN639_10320 [Candidatus Epulonipiscium fishelsonii]|uniref:Uncharacterized protein n=1 Tax=Candidatus Epulonipiscium fishelsonii TaxID=77094 RepID=A0ACC8XC55_9FIRM|nr:hypothetical protein AN396_01050 [Epulopiscium sp. SCG-B11WGA-EpuloA1]ONI43573.1 hypothetical protein AN639_10320 [Epulopiscium sp. SCG-B05WGA-EpuloA1]